MVNQWLMVERWCSNHDTIRWLINSPTRHQWSTNAPNLMIDWCLIGTEASFRWDFQGVMRGSCSFKYQRFGYELINADWFVIFVILQGFIAISLCCCIPIDSFCILRMVSRWFMFGVHGRPSCVVDYPQWWGVHTSKGCYTQLTTEEEEVGVLRS